MYAVLKTGGKQYRVEPGQVLRVEKLEAEEGASVRFEQVLMIGGGAETAIGSPLLEGAFVEADVLAHVKADKVISFVRRRRKHSSKRTRRPPSAPDDAARDRHPARGRRDGARRLGGP